VGWWTDCLLLLCFEQLHASHSAGQIPSTRILIAFRVWAQRVELAQAWNQKRPWAQAQMQAQMQAQTQAQK